MVFLLEMLILQSELLDFQRVKVETKIWRMHRLQHIVFLVNFWFDRSSLVHMGQNPRYPNGTLK